MKVHPRTDELALAYEALRAQAMGEIPPMTPRGLALFLSGGFPAWMKAWTPLAPLPPAPTPVRSEREMLAGAGVEVVRLLAEMVLGCQRRWTMT